MGSLHWGRHCLRIGTSWAHRVCTAQLPRRQAAAFQPYPPRSGSSCSPTSQTHALFVDGHACAAGWAVHCQALIMGFELALCVLRSLGSCF